MVQQPTHYQLLGIEPAADLETIKRAYRDKIRRLHPDRFAAERARLQERGDAIDLHAMDRQIEEAKQKTQKINAAYAVLADADARKAYDRLLSDQRQAAYQREIRQQRYQHDEHGRRTVKSRPHQHNRPASKKEAIPWAFIAVFIVILLAGSAWLSSIISPDTASDGTRMLRYPTAEGAISMADLQATTNAQQTAESQRATRRAAPTPTPRASSDNEALADRMMELALYSTAVETYSQALDMRPNDGQLYFKRGLAYVAMSGKTDERSMLAALDDFHAALEHNDALTAVYRERGLLYFTLWQASNMTDATYATRARTDLDQYSAQADISDDDEVQAARTRLSTDAP